MSRLVIVPLAALALGLGVSACGSDSSSDVDTPGGGSASSGSSSAPQATTQVTMKNLQFGPKAITAKVGQTITFTNTEGIPHNVVSQSGPQKFESDTFGKGGTFEVKLTKPGTIDYVCTIHPGMEGTIKVTG